MDKTTNNRQWKKLLQILLPILIAVLAAAVTGWLAHSESEPTTTATATQDVSASDSTSPDVNSAAGSVASLDLSALPEYTGEPYIYINNNEPEFLEQDITDESFEYYGPLDKLGRCTACFACVGKDLMPTEKRGNISSVKPTGWHTTNYSNVDGGSLYNRCHLIAHQLTAENANERNLITGTRYMNTKGMLPFEEATGNYVRETGNHVLYRVTPIFVGNELVARGVQMEGLSIEDEGEGICFNVYCFNVQPDITIDYLTGDSALTSALSESTTKGNTQTGTYILNTKSKRFHTPDCLAIEGIKDDNKEQYTGSRDKLINEGYTPCGQCNP